MSTTDLNVYPHTVALHNLLNGLHSTDSTFFKPSDTNFKWTRANLQEFLVKLNSLKQDLDYNEVNPGDTNLTLTSVLDMKKISIEESKLSSLDHLTDIIYSSLYLYSDKWTLVKMAYIVGCVEVLVQKLYSVVFPQKVSEFLTLIDSAMELGQDTDLFRKIVVQSEAVLCLSNLELAELVKASVPTVTRWKSGNTVPHVLVRSAIYKILKKKILLSGEGK